MSTIKGYVWGNREKAPDRNAWWAKWRPTYMWVYYYEIRDGAGNVLASDNTCGWRNVYDDCMRRVKEIEASRETAA